MLRNVFQSIESMDSETITQNLAEKRRALRVKSYAQSQVVLEGQHYKSVVTELGLDGLRLKSAEAPLAEGQLVEVIYSASGDPEQLGPVRIQIAWVQRAGRELVAGARFADTRDNMKRSWVRFLLQEIGFDESRTFQRRQHIRVEASIPGRISWDQAGENATLDGRIVNIGIGGALFESRHAPPRGAQVALEMSLWRILPTLRLAATVLDHRPDGEELVLISLKFGALEPPQVKLLGNYIINMINQSARE